jgi:hypothetical protein
MSIHRIAVALLILTLIGLTPAYLRAQTEEQPPSGGGGKIGGEITNVVENYPIRLGIFRVRPRLSAGTSYDSNVFSDPLIEESDYFTAITPGAVLGLKLGRRGYFLLREDINILFYQNRSELNDVFNTTSATLGLGSRRLLVELGGRYYRRKSRVDPEFDQQVQQRFAGANVDVTFALRRRTDLHFNFGSNDANYDNIQDVVTDLPTPPDTRDIFYGVGIERDLTDQISVGFVLSKGYTDFTDLTNPLNTDNRSDFWRVLGGLDFSGRRIVGRSRIGLEEREELRILRENFRSLFVDVSVDYAFARRLSIGGYIIRQTRASALLQNDFRLLVEVGARGCVPIANAFFLDGKIAFGLNDYGNRITVTGDVVTQDDFRRYEAGANFVLPKDFVVRVGTTYTDRISNVDFLNKNRFTFNVGIGFELTSTPRRQAPSCTPVSMDN